MVEPEEGHLMPKILSNSSPKYAAGPVKDLKKNPCLFDISWTIIATTMVQPY